MMSKLTKANPAQKKIKRGGGMYAGPGSALKMGLVFDNFYNTFVILCGTIDSGR